MYIKKLELAEIQLIYEKYMKKDFPASELRPFAQTQRLYLEGHYEGYGMYDDQDLFVAYALYIKPPRHEIHAVLLDYLAVVSSARGTGSGSIFLQQMQQMFHDTDVILLEVENPDYALTREDLYMRKKRIRFYMKNELSTTGIQTRVYDMEYKILAMPLRHEPSDHEVIQAMSGIYHKLFDPAVFELRRERA
ncbi:MAG: hypothetical protein KA965_07050 [Butyrivibrio sp.]|nr:hypothetical protein [Butyrivibrio sp.]